MHNPWDPSTRILIAFKCNWSFRLGLKYTCDNVLGHKNVNIQYASCVSTDLVLEKESRTLRRFSKNIFTRNHSLAIEGCQKFIADYFVLFWIRKPAHLNFQASSLSINFVMIMDASSPLQNARFWNSYDILCSIVILNANLCVVTQKWTTCIVWFLLKESLVYWIYIN